MAWRYLRYHWIKTCVLLASISLVLFLPLGLQVVVQQGADTLTSRAASTPLLIGARGSAVDLTLAALYFRDPTVDPVPYREATQVNQSGLAAGIPLHLRFRAGRHRIVGTTTEYFELRGLVPSAGRAMAMLGECVLGANAAHKLGVQVGGYVLSTPAGAFDVAGTFPLKMKVVGVLAREGTPDDEAVVTDIKTTWVIAGLAHGHMDMLSPGAESGVLKREEGNLVANPAVLSYTEITQKNLDSFHFHGDPAEFPVDAILAAPYDRKSSIMLRGRYEAEAADVQMLVPLHIIDGLLETVFSVRDYIVLGGIGVAIATVAITALVFVLSVRLRHREIETIRKIGGPRRRLWAILSAEILMVVFGAGIIAAGMTMAVSGFGGLLIRVVSGQKRLGFFGLPRQIDAPDWLASGTFTIYSQTRSDHLRASMSAILNLTEAKARFSEVVDRASQGEEIIVTRMGHPVARISRYEPATSNRRLGLFEGRIHLADDFDEWPTDVARDLGLID